MTRLELQIGRLKDDLKILVTREALPRILNAAKPRIKIAIAERFADAFSATRLYSELYGNQGKDSIRAVLGLDPGDVDGLVEGLEDAIKQTTEVVQLISRQGQSFVGLGSGNAVAFVIRTPSLPKYLEDAGFGSYVSTNGFDVPWLRWLLKGSGTLDHGVIGLKVPNFAVSKSGFAVMRPIEFNILPFDIDDYNRFTDAFEQGDNEKNFLSEMAQNEDFRRDANAIIFDELLRTIQTLNIQI